MDFKIFNLGLIDFEEALEFQKEIFRKIENDSFHNALIMCRHYPVITMGRRTNPESIRVSPPELEKTGIRAYKIERGGDVTYHGPGQLTAYPILNLNYLKKDIHFLLRQLEGAIMDFLEDFGIKASRRTGLTGIWVGHQKIASIGIAIRKWITFHGLSINIKKCDLYNFALIKPCGMDIEMTSLETVLGRDIEIGQISGIMAHKLKNRFLIGQ
jgi:lipoate-protein ligase B